MDQTLDTALAMFTSRHASMDEATTTRLKTDLLTYLKCRLNSIAATGLSYVDRHNASAAHRFQLKRSDLLATARKAAA